MNPTITLIKNAVTLAREDDQIKWSDIGRECIEGGRYRFISPVWNSSGCAKLGEDRIRPLKLMNCAVTNDWAGRCPPVTRARR